MFPRPSWPEISFAIAFWSPVTIFTPMPIRLAVSMVERESSRRGSNRGMTPSIIHAPLSSVRATPRERKPCTANSFTASSTCSRTLASGATKSSITWGAPFEVLNVRPPARRQWLSVRFWTGSNG